MSKKFTAVLTREEEWYVAHCVELGVVSQGKTIEEAQANLKEAVELYLESFGGEVFLAKTFQVKFHCFLEVRLCFFNGFALAYHA